MIITIYLFKATTHFPADIPHIADLSAPDFEQLSGQENYILTTHSHFMAITNTFQNAIDIINNYKKERGDIEILLETTLLPDIDSLKRDIPEIHLDNFKLLDAKELIQVYTETKSEISS